MYRSLGDALTVLPSLDNMLYERAVPAVPIPAFIARTIQTQGIPVGGAVLQPRSYSTPQQTPFDPRPGFSAGVQVVWRW